MDSSETPYKPNLRSDRDNIWGLYFLYFYYIFLALVIHSICFCTSSDWNVRVDNLGVVSVPVIFIKKKSWSNDSNDWQAKQPIIKKKKRFIFTFASILKVTIGKKVAIICGISIEKCTLFHQKYWSGSGGLVCEIQLNWICYFISVLRHLQHVSINEKNARDSA